MWWLIPVLLVAALLLVLVLRAAAFRPAGRKTEPAAAPAVTPVADAEQAARHLAALIQKKTVSNRDASKIDTAEFEGAVSLLATLYPHVHRTLTLERVDGYGLLYRWRGREQGAPAVLMAHYDVVPAQEREWHFPPFSGTVESGEIRGRGAIDTKGTLISILEATEHLLADGFTPKNDIYFSFSNNEETAGDTAPDIVSLFRGRGVTPDFVLDEGGAVVEHVFPGVEVPVALIGVTEKGITDIVISVNGAGCHASAPPARTATIDLAKALVRLDRHPFPAKLSRPTEEMFLTVGRYMPFRLRLIFANLWLFRPLLPKLLARAGGEFAAMMRTTVAVTQLEGGPSANVLASGARAVANIRIAVGETVSGVLERVRRVIRKTGATAETAYGIDPSPVSVTAGPQYDRLREAVAETYTPAVAPYVMFGGSDSRHFARISDHVYRFTPYVLTKEERGRIHGADEALPVEKLGKCVEFYTRLIKKC